MVMMVMLMVRILKIKMFGHMKYAGHWWVLEVMQGAFKGGILTSPPPPHCDKTIVEGPSQPVAAMSVTILSFGTYRVFFWFEPPQKNFFKWGCNNQNGH